MVHKGEGCQKCPKTVNMVYEWSHKGFKNTVITDTSFIETVVFAARAGIEMSPRVESWIHSKRYRDVFFLMPIEEYESSKIRMESLNVALQISNEIQNAYRHYGYNLVIVPPMPLAERCKFVEERMEVIG